MRYIWTENGLKNLGRIIRQSRESRNLNLRDAACLMTAIAQSSVPFSTLASVERGNCQAKYNTLAAIAASGLIEYQGRTLDIFDFIRIASEDFNERKAINMEALAELIRLHLNKNQLSIQQFARICRIPVLDLEAILCGEQPPDFEDYMIKISSQIISPITRERFNSYLELAAYCNLKKNDLTLKWEQSHLTNGYSR